MGNPYTTAIAISKPITQTSVFPKQLLIPIWSDSKPLIQKMKKRMSPIQLSAATAMAAGVKTYNNAIALDNDKSKTETVLERAKKWGNQRVL